LNLKKAIEREHSKNQAIKIVQFIGSDTSRFSELVQIFLDGPYRITQRASWPLSKCVEQHPELITPHLPVLLSAVQQPGHHVAVKRNVMRLLQFVRVPRRHQARVADLCFQFLTNRSEPIAVRVFSMTVLANLVVDNPSLGRELCIIIEDELPYASAGFRSRGLKILKHLAT
jgi:hypothetical protein